MSAVLRACRPGRKTGKEVVMFHGLLLLLPTSIQAFFPGAKASEKLKEIASGNGRNADVGQRDAEEVVEAGGGGPAQGSAAREVGDGPEEDEKQEEEDQEQPEHPDQEQQQEQQHQRQQQREHLPAKQVERSSRSIKRSTVESVKSVAGGLGMMSIIMFLMQRQDLTDLIVSS